MKFSPFLAILLLLPGVALAAEDSDLDLIPSTLPNPVAQAEAAPAANGAAPQAYIENAFTSFGNRGNLAVPSPVPNANWQERLLLDLRGDWALLPNLRAVYGGRLNAEAADSTENPTPHILRHDFREGYLSWQPSDGVYVDAGRINLKSGVALGDNPTDYFRARAVIDPLTADPAVLREDRLGALMLRGQFFWNGGSLTLAYAPRVAHAAPILAASQLPSFDPLFSHTNTTDRFLAKASFSVTDDVSPEVLLYHAGADTRLGLDVAKNLGGATVLYAEWSGGTQQSLVAEALSFGQGTFTLPALPRFPLSTNPAREFQNELAAGLSYAPGGKVTLNAEYHWHQAGLSDAQWQSWFAAGGAKGAPAGLASALWYIRAYAADQQVMPGQHEIFLRASWNDAFVRDLELDAFSDISLQDGSLLAQVSATYDIDAHWRLGGLVLGSTGGARSLYGSAPQSIAVLAKLARYF